MPSCSSSFGATKPIAHLVRDRRTSRADTQTKLQSHEPLVRLWTECPNRQIRAVSATWTIRVLHTQARGATLSQTRRQPHQHSQRIRLELPPHSEPWGLARGCSDPTFPSGAGSGQHPPPLPPPAPRLNRRQLNQEPQLNWSAALDRFVAASARDEPGRSLEH